MTVSQKTLKLLAAETGNDAEDADVSGNQVDFGGSDHFMVFPSYDAAERYAKQYLIELVEESPADINSDMMSYYLTMRPGDVRAFASDAADLAYENAEYNEEDATEAYEDEYDRVEAALKDDPIGLLRWTWATPPPTPTVRAGWSSTPTLSSVTPSSMMVSRALSERRT